MMRGLIWAGVLAVATVQLLGLAQSLHPAFDSVAHFRLILSVLLIPALALALIMRRRVLAGFTLMSLVAGLAGMAPVIGSNAITGEPDLTVLQFNAYARNATPLEIVGRVKESRPDVITLQEVWRPILVIMDELKADYPYQNLCRSGWVGGTVILSRWPVTDQGCATGLAWMRIEKDARKMSVASLHLTWPWPMPQAKQIAELDPVLRAMPRPAVLAGDFNAAPWSTAVAHLSAPLDAQVAPGLRLTWMPRPSGWAAIPILPIDQILLPKDATAEVSVLPRAGSDHLPLFARIKLPAR